MRSLNYIPIILFILIAVTLYISLTKHTKVSNNYIYQLSKSKLNLLNDKELNLEEFKGNFYALHFFSSWCQHCKEDYNLLAKLKWETKIPVIGIALNDKKSKLLSLKKSTTPYDHIAIDKDMEISNLINNRVLPSTIIINPEGEMIFYYIGTLNEEEIENNVIPKIIHH